MRKSIVIAVSVLVVLLGLGIGCKWWVIDHGAISVTAYFTCPGTTKPEDNNPKKNVIIPLIKELGNGDRLDIAMYILTDDDIKNAISQAYSQGATVRIYLEAREACNKGADATYYRDQGIPVKIDNRSSDIMHNKFAVINSDTVITGSANWSENADKNNWEDILVIHGSAVVKRYENAFNKMWNIWSKDFEGCGST